jgi:HEAT repeat protein
LARVFSSEAELAFALAVSAAALASALLLLVAIAVLRGERGWRRRRLARQQGAWRDALHLATEDPERARLPAIHALDLPDFVIHWNHVQASLKGPAHANLARLLRRFGIDDRLLALLDRRSLRLQLIAITALGYLREERAWEAISRLARDENTVLSFAAARALLRIAPAAALDFLADDIVGRPDWSLARLGSVFQELGPDVITSPLARVIAARPRRGLDRAVKLARFAHRRRIAPIVREWLGASDDAEVIVAGLDYVEGDEDLRLVRGAARHADWRVRMAAARALGRLGGPAELGTLLELLRDSAWWVRYHAAQALTRLHGLDPRELEALQANSHDAFAADMLAHARADRGHMP